MSDTTLSGLLADIERLLLPSQSEGKLDNCYFRVTFPRDSGLLMVQIFPSVEQAQAAFLHDGNRYVAPTARIVVRRPEATADETSDEPTRFDPPIVSTESLPNVGDENFVWRGYGSNTRGVIKLRVGRFLSTLNMPTVEDAERLARQLANRGIGR